MLTWNDNYKMGIEEFDNDHQQLFKLAQRAVNMMQEHSEEPGRRMFILRETLTYINNHFIAHAKKEERYMKEIGYKGYALHKLRHDEFCRVQMEKYRKIVKSGECSKEDVWDFIGNGLGWLLEHIATDDLAIVGKGTLSQSDKISLNETNLEKEVNLLLTSSLNLKVNARVVNKKYEGEYFGKAVYQKMIYTSGTEEITVVSGIERLFLLSVAKMIYGDKIEDEIELILSTLQIFGTHFWRSLGQRFAGGGVEINVKESNFVVEDAVLKELKIMNPTTSMLFTSDMGKFFVSSNFAYVEK